MSLAELFFAKHPRRPILSRFRSRRALLDRAKAAPFTSHLSRFTLEALEPRLLMSVAPVPDLALQETAIEPAAVVIQGTTTVLALTGDAAPASGVGTGGTFSGFNAPDLNDAGQSAFFATVTGSPSTQGIFRSSGPGLVTALVRAQDVAPDGNGRFVGFSGPQLLNGGTVIFFGTLTGTTRGAADDTGIFLTDGQEMIQIAREGQALAGSTVISSFFSSSSVNDVGQVGYWALLPGGRNAIVLFTVPELHYRSTTSGAWDSGSNWQLSLTPGVVHDLFIDPLNGVTVTGPAAATTVDSLTIGAKVSGAATLQLNGGGNLSVTNGINIQSLGAVDQQLGTLASNVLTNAGSLTQGVGATLSVSSLNNTGFGTVRGTVTTTSGLSNHGMFTLDLGTIAGAGQLTNDFGALFQGDGTITTAVLNNGRLVPAGLLVVSGTTTNIGQLLVGIGGSFRPTGGLSNTGFIDLDGGTVSGTGTVTNQVGGVVQGNGSITAPISNAGLLGVLSGQQLIITTPFTNTGQTQLSGPTAQLSGGAMTNGVSGVLSGQGTVANQVLNSGVIRADGGTLRLTAAGNSNLSSGQIQTTTGTIVLYSQGLTSNAGLIALTGGRFDNSTVALTNTGRLEGRGTFATGGLTNATGGVIHFADGPTDVFGTVTNNATLNVTNGTSTFFNAVTNSATGTIKNTGGVTRFLGGLTNNGAFVSDPADNHFTDLTLSDTGYLVGGAGDRFIVSDDLLNSSTRAANWNTSAAELIFENGTDVHDFSIAGADHAGAVGGFSNNFSWGTVRLAAGQTLRLQDGNATAGGALYVKNLILDGGLSQINSITGNEMNIYYDSLASANGYLGEQTYNLQNGGVLAPIRSLDFDANGLADALTDGILVVRHLFGFTGGSLTTGVVDPAGLRTSASALGSYLGQSQNSLLDVDGNGTADALSDGIVIIRYLFGFTGDALITGVVDPAGTRHTAAAIEAFLAGFLPGSTSAAFTQVHTPAADSSLVLAQESDAPTTDLSLAYVQRSWIQNFVGKDTSVVDASDEEELLIALPA